MLPITHWLIRVQGIGEDMPNNMFPLSTLNQWSFTKHLSWPSKPWLPKFLRWDLWARIMSRKWDVVPWVWWDNIAMGFGPWALAPFCEYGLFWGLKEIFPKSIICWCGVGYQWNKFHVVWKVCPQHVIIISNFFLLFYYYYYFGIKRGFI